MNDVTGTTEAPRPQKRKRRWPWWVLGVIVLIVVVGEPIIGAVIRSKLISTVESRVNGKLRVGWVTYIPPYRVRVHDVGFAVEDEAGRPPLEMVGVKRIDLRLAKLPFGDGPLVIEKLAVDGPALHVIQTADGLAGMRGLVKPTAKPEGPKKKLSEMFELRQFVLRDGRVEYEDRTRPGTEKLVWKEVEASSATLPTSPAVYRFDLNAGQADIGTLKLAGVLDIDEALVDARSLDLMVNVGEAKRESAVPPQLQGLLKKYGIQGKVTVKGRGNVPLKKPGDGKYVVDIGLEDGKGDVSEYVRPIDKLTARARVIGKAGEPIALAPALEAVTARQVLHVDNANVLLDVAGKTWDVRKLDLRMDASTEGLRSFDVLPTTAATTRPRQMSAGGRLTVTAAGSGPFEIKTIEDFRKKVKFEVVATASDFEAHPPQLAAPVRLATGAPIIANQDVIRLANMNVRYGFDTISITALRIPLRDLPRIIRAEEFSGTITFDPHTPAYPGIAGEFLAHFKPAGPFEVGGMATYDRDGPPDRKLNYHLLVHSEQGAVTFAQGPGEIPITRIHADVSVDPGIAKVEYFSANVFGGLMDARAVANFEPYELKWVARGSIKDFDLRDAVQRTTGKQYDTAKLAGRVMLNFDMAGADRPESLKGSGNAELYQGNLFEVPILSDVLGIAQLGKGMTGSEGAVSFAIKDSKVALRPVAIGAPAIGVQGRGTIGFDKSLNMELTVAPLGDWKKRFRQTGVPLVGDVLGEVAGVLQTAVNTAASVALYQFDVKGTADKPRITPVPTPVLTKGAAGIFGAMLAKGEGKSMSLSEEIRRIEAQPAGERIEPEKK